MQMVNGGFQMRKKAARIFFRKRFGRHVKLSLKMLLGTIAVGCITGSVCAFFELIPVKLGGMRHAYLDVLAGRGIPLWMVLAAAFLISMIIAGIAVYITKKYAPEAGGSGIPEIEGAMVDLRPVRYKRVLPVKFFGGVLSLSSGMVLGREGPSIQIGGNLGAMVADIFKISKADFYVLLAAGAASGLASAFNAPLAGILFVLEELRPQFNYRFSSIQAVTIAVICSTVVRSAIVGSSMPVFSLPVFDWVNMRDLTDFIFLGLTVGVCGVLFNKSVEIFQNLYARVCHGRILINTLIVAVVGGIYGMVSYLLPEASGSGMQHIAGWVLSSESLGFLGMLLFLRFLGIMLCFCSGIPGGIFAPSLSLGALIGAIFGLGMLRLGVMHYDPGIMAIVGMGAFFAASVRAPVTGIILICEMTNNFQFLLPMMVAVLAAVQTASMLKGRPIYTQILERTLRIAGDMEVISEYRRFKKERNVE